MYTWKIYVVDIKYFTYLLSINNHVTFTYGEKTINFKIYIKQLFIVHWLKLNFLLNIFYILIILLLDSGM